MKLQRRYFFYGVNAASLAITLSPIRLRNLPASLRRSGIVYLDTVILHFSQDVICRSKDFIEGGM